ncbi:MAG: prephenate dehydrogenase [Bacteroidales bacterium]|nr:prephenate dehydrogenase [Bacteroidales bacterium]
MTQKSINITIIGVGLIGGSLALDLRYKYPVNKIYGADKNPAHLIRAKQLGLIDEAVSLQKAIELSDLLILAVPVNVSIKLLPGILDKLDKQVVIDVGSTKANLIKSIINHPNKGRFVATHPMAGTEFSGPDAAIVNLYKDKNVIFCDIENSDDDAHKLVKDIYESIGMNILYMESNAHDIHAAYVSHISHISSFALSLTVLDKEKDHKKILNMASGGFESTVRLAKSAASMWTPIFMLNQDNVLDVMDNYIEKLKEFREAISAGDEQKIVSLIEESNKIRKVLDKKDEPELIDV